MTPFAHYVRSKLTLRYFVVRVPIVLIWMVGVWALMVMTGEFR